MRVCRGLYSPVQIPADATDSVMWQSVFGCEVDDPILMVAKDATLPRPKPHSHLRIFIDGIDKVFSQSTLGNGGNKLLSVEAGNAPGSSKPYHIIRATVDNQDIVACQSVFSCEVDELLPIVPKDALPDGRKPQQQDCLSFRSPG